jgi:hypothetical protein
MLDFAAVAVDSKAWKVYEQNKLKEKRIKEAKETAWSTWRVIRGILLYIPNRIVDATDIITLNFSVGDFFEWQMQATRYVQFGGFTGENYVIGSAYRRQYGTWHKNSERFGFGFLEEEVTVVDDTTGSVNEYLINFPHFLVANRRLDAFNYNDVDFWEAGFNIGWFIGFGFAMHPSEFADFFTGIFLVDISNDDF